MIKFIKTPAENNQYDHAKIEMEIPSGLQLTEMLDYYRDFLRAIGYDVKEIIEDE
jgi:hypothetical protein